MINDAAKFKKADQQAKKRRVTSTISPPPPSPLPSPPVAPDLGCRVDELQGIDRQIADIKSSLDGALGASIDDDSKVAV